MLTSNRGRTLGCLCELPGGPWTSCSLPEIFFSTVLPFYSLLLGMKGTFFFFKGVSTSSLLGFLCQKALGCSVPPLCCFYPFTSPRIGSGAPYL